MMMSSSTDSSDSQAAIARPSTQRETLSMDDVSITPVSVMDDFQVIFQHSNTKSKKMAPGGITLKKNNRDAKEVAFRSLMASIQESETSSTKMGKSVKEENLDLPVTCKKVTFDQSNDQLESETPSDCQVIHKKPTPNLRSFEVEDDDAISEITDNHTLASHATNRSAKEIPRLPTSMSNVVIPKDEDSIPSQKCLSKDTKSFSRRKKKKGPFSQQTLLEKDPSPPMLSTDSNIPIDIPIDRNVNHNSGKFSSLSSQSLNSNQISSDSSGNPIVSNEERRLREEQLAKELLPGPKLAIDTKLPEGEARIAGRIEDYNNFPPISLKHNHIHPRDTHTSGKVKSIHKDNLKQPADVTFPPHKAVKNEPQKYASRSSEDAFSNLDLLSSPELFSQHVAVGIPLNLKDLIEVPNLSKDSKFNTTWHDKSLNSTSQELHIKKNDQVVDTSKLSRSERIEDSYSSKPPSNHRTNETESLRNETGQDIDTLTLDNSYATHRVSHTQRHKQDNDVSKNNRALHATQPLNPSQGTSASETKLTSINPSFDHHSDISGTKFQSICTSDEVSVEVSTETGNPLLTRYPRDRTINRALQDSSLSLENSTSSLHPRLDESSFRYRDSYPDLLHTSEQDLVSLPLSTHEDLSTSHVYLGNRRTDNRIWDAYRGDRYKAARDFKTVLLGILCVLLVLGLCIVVAIVAIRQERQPAAPSDVTNVTSKMTYDDLLEFLSSISTDDGFALRYRNSPQFRAVTWLSQSDQHASFWDNEYRIIQRYVMATLYFNLGGEHWLKQENWLSNDHECLWYTSGKSSCGSESLTELDLSVNGLVGDIPAEIGLLTELTALDLSRNDIFHQIPENLWNLKALSKLILSRNVK
jgi:hypothetical protein